MGYLSLIPPGQDTPDDSDNSIQGSPLLDTGSKFPSNADTSLSFDFQPDSSFQVRDENTNSYGLQGSPYGDSDYYEEPYQASNAKGYSEVPTYSPGKEALGEPASLQISENRPSLNINAIPAMRYGSETGQYGVGFSGSSVLNGESSPSASDRMMGRAVDDDGFIPQMTHASPPSSPQRATIHQRTLRTKPSRLTPHLEETREESVHDPNAHASLNFDLKSSRPKSAFIKGSLNTPSTETPEDDEDALPFQTTKQMAWQGRPKSMVTLSQLEQRGPVMSRETFENYRKSVSSLGMLKHMSSTGSFRSYDETDRRRRRGAHAKSGSDDEDGDAEKANDEEGSEGEEMAHTQERKRMSARIRQEQDARMSVYRQRMTKIIGGTTEPSITLDYKSTQDDASSRRLSSSASIAEEGGDNEEIMDDIPLSILQAHGFPKPRRKSASSSPGPSPNQDQGHGSAASVKLSSPTPQLSPNALRPASTSRFSLISGASPSPGRVSPSLPNNRSNPEWQLPPVFGNKDGMLSRGLVSEIAREEEYRKRRNTIGFDHYSQELMSRQQDPRRGPASIAPSTGTAAQPDELQNKLDQVLTLLTKLSGDPAAAGPHQATMWAAAQQRAPSIRSSYSSFSAPRNSQLPNGQFANGQFPNGQFPNEQYMGSRESFMQPPQSPFMNTPPPATPMGMSPMTPMGPMGPMGPAGPMQNQFPGQFPDPGMHPSAPGSVFPLPRGPLPSHNVSNRPSRMRMVNKNNEEEEDDEEEWKKLLEKRKALRDQWKQQTEVSSTTEIPT